MRTRFVYFFSDLALVLAATLTAFFLREGQVQLAYGEIGAFLPFLAATGLAALAVIPLSGSNRTVWRLSTLPDYLRASLAVLAISLAAVILTFSYNRLDGIARSLPILQVLVGVFFLVGARVSVRLYKAMRQRRKPPAKPLRVSPEMQLSETVLLIGLNRLTEMYLQTASDFGAEHIKVAGILGNNDRHVGRLVGVHKVIGCPEDSERVIKELGVHGVNVDRIVVTLPPEELSSQARDVLLHLCQNSALELTFLAQDLGLVGPFTSGTAPTARQSTASASLDEVTFHLGERYREKLASRPYWRLKRFCDVVGALLLILVLAPVMAATALVLAAKVGVPVLFWQQRPGLGGRPFWLAKFRTMAPALSADGRILSDAERTNAVCDFIRRTRLDELPQLFQVLTGQMSFVGPRPLLPRDQSAAHQVRLLVRPGLTGWAQIVGGRDISVDDKAALDVWYVSNASFALDTRILLQTTSFVVFGERQDRSRIDAAWQSLAEAGILRGSRAQGAEGSRIVAAE